MKASELMLGDYVLNEPAEGVQFYDRVILISDTPAFEKMKPVPLTYELLAKNFQTYDENERLGWLPNYDEDNSFHLEWIDDNNKIIMEHVCYVHEVQHLLKLVGCDKEIKL